MYSHLARPRVVALVFGVATACADDASSHESEGDSESFDTAEELPTSEAISSGTDDGGTSSSDADTSTTGQTTTAEDSTTASSSESTAGEPDPELCLPPDAEQGVTWARGYSSAGNEEVVDVAAHPDGGVIAVGFYSGTLDFGDSVEQPVSPDEYPLEAFVAKYTATGELVWLRVFVGSGGSDMAESVAVSDAGHVLVVGGFSGTVDFGDGPHDSAGQTDGFLVELDGDSGETRWVRVFGGPWADVSCYPPCPDQRGAEVAYVGEDILMAVGHTSFDDIGGGELGDGSIAIGRYGPDGEHLWSMATGGDGNVWLNGLGVDDSGAFHLVGTSWNRVDFGDGPLPGDEGGGFVARFDSDGGHLWSRRFVHDPLLTAYAIPYFHAMDLTADGDILIAGSHTGELDLGGPPLEWAGEEHSRDAFVARFTADGDHVWSRSYGGDQWEEAFGVAAGPDGRIALTGVLQSADFGGGMLSDPRGSPVPFLTVLESDGTHLYSAAFVEVSDSPPLRTMSAGHTVAFHSANEVFVGGVFDRSIELGSFTLESVDPSIYNYGEAFLAHVELCAP